jgi:hypothetical protein
MKLIFENLITVVIGFFVIRWSDEIANFLDAAVGNIFRDAGNSFVIKVVGIFIILSGLGYMLLSLIK